MGNPMDETHRVEVGENGFTPGLTPRSQVNSTLLLSPSTNEPMMYLRNGSPCPLDSQSAASTAIRVSAPTAP
jgi:hypothetical protein